MSMWKILVPFSLGALLAALLLQKKEPFAPPGHRTASRQREEAEQSGK
jgi:hypothetical protein